MVNDRDKPLARIVAVAQQQLELLEDARRRTEIDTGGLAKVALELLLDAIAREARDAGGALEAYAERHEAYRTDHIDAREHRAALGEGWSCKHCKNEVVQDVAIAMKKNDRPRVSLICRACGRTSPIAPLGLATFNDRFGHLADDPKWDPTKNGFVVKGS